jgi:phosphatidylethanolamine/phosphatidyl-N-methylethanolamine N-methyltransferase
MDRQFIFSLIRSPRGMGAIAPSSKRLAMRMVEDIHPQASVLELGPGTGVITREILRRGVNPKKLALIEYDAHLVSSLRKFYPDVHTIQGNATDPSVYRQINGNFDFIISSLPLVLFNEQQIKELMLLLKGRMHKSSVIHQFTYAKKLPISTELIQQLNFKSDLLGKIFWNIPPARVFRLSLLNESTYSNHQSSH